MSWLSKLAEQRIQAARASGQLQGLTGEGQPLPDRPGDAFVSAGDAVGFRIMAEAGARLIVVPAAFNMTTGPLHWELAIRSRAVDNQCYIAACSSGRDTSADYCAWGHSTVVDPWGKVVATTGPEESIVRHTLDFDLVEQVRQELPILASRRQDLYTCILSGGKHIG